MNTINISQRLLMLTLPFFLPVILAHAGTVSVTGVVLSGDNGRRLAAVKVQLAVDKKNGGIVTDDSTSREGVYNLSSTSVTTSVNGLWVICEDTNYTAVPIEATLEAEKHGVRRSKMRDMVAASSTQSLRGVTDVAWHLLAVQETEGVKVKLGLTSREDATKTISQKATSILRRAPIRKGEANKVDQLVGEMRRQFRKEVSPTLFLTKEGILKLLDDLEKQSRPEEPKKGAPKIEEKPGG
jgi:hypothetical protein